MRRQSMIQSMNSFEGLETTHRAYAAAVCVFRVRESSLEGKMLNRMLEKQ